jgi:general secretion pathway protein E/type IV pilus assembly protein PilB
MWESICSLLVRKGTLSESQAQYALEVHRTQPSKRFDHLLAELKLVSEPAVLETMAEVLGLRYVDLASSEIDPEAIRVVPAKLVYRYNLFPVARYNGTITVATDDPWNTAALDEVRVRTGLKVEPVLAESSGIEQQIKRHFGVGGETVGQLVTEQLGGPSGAGDALDDDAADDLAEEASVVRLVNEILTEAIRERASDVHIEPEEGGLQLRYRIDGILQQQALPTELKRFRAAIVSRLKIMARLNIAEKRLPQDGRITMRVEGREVDIRVSVIPMLYGEGVVLRILDKGRMLLSLQQIGMDDETYSRFRELILRPHGIILVTGPTGSGKSTTLYSALREIKNDTTKIITIEDPVEYHVNGISQIQVQSKIGLTFATALRSILRHDPDVVLVGEIRDRETAEIAIEAALTGHLVFSTLHTNDAASAFARLTDMGIEPYLVASSLEGVLAQRLVRVICPACKVGYEPGREDVPPDLPLRSIGRLHRGAGCRECRGTGYTGRTGIFELLVPNPAIRQMIMDQAHSAEIQTAAVRSDMMTLRVSGTRKVLEGITTLEEVARVTKADEAPARTRPVATPGLGREAKAHASQMFRQVDQ